MVSPPIWGEKWRRSEHAHASYPGLFFCPPGFSPYKRREERRVQGLAYWRSRLLSKKAESIISKSWYLNWRVDRENLVMNYRPDLLLLGILIFFNKHIWPRSFASQTNTCFTNIKFPRGNYQPPVPTQKHYVYCLNRGLEFIILIWNRNHENIFFYKNRCDEFSN